MFRFAALVPVCLVVVLVAGCAPGKSDIEKSIRNEMKSSLGVEISTVDLQKQSDGTYTGTATAANGDIYDVTTTPPKSGKTEWKAVPSQIMVERLVRADLEAKTQTKVQSLALTKSSPGNYTGTAELTNGKKFKVTTSLEGKTLMLKTEPMN